MLLPAILVLAQRPVPHPIYPKVAWLEPTYTKLPDLGAGYVLNQGFLQGAQIESKGRNLDPIPNADVQKAKEGAGLPPQTADDWSEDGMRSLAKTLNARYVGFVHVDKLRTVGKGYAVDGTVTVVDANGGFVLKAVPISTLPLSAPFKPKGMLPPLKDEVPPTGVDTLGKQLARNAVVALATKAKSL